LITAILIHWVRLPVGRHTHPAPWDGARLGSRSGANLPCPGLGTKGRRKRCRRAPSALLF